MTNTPNSRQDHIRQICEKLTELEKTDVLKRDGFWQHRYAALSVDYARAIHSEDS